MWSTPNAHDGRRPGVDDRSTQGRNLNREAAAWRYEALVNAQDPIGGGQAERVSKGGGLRKIEDQAEFWGTPTSRDQKDGSSAEANVPTNGLLGRQVIREWQTPQTPTGGGACQGKW